MERGYQRIKGAFAALALTLTGAAIVLAAPSAESKPGDNDDVGKRLSDRAEIMDLGYCYAEATDRVATGDVAGGAQIYSTCFTPNAVLKAYFPGADPNGPAGVSAIGPVAWANAVDGVFTSSGYSATQHLMSNFRIDIDGNSATMTSYLHATHVLDPDGAVEVANGTYVDQIVRTNKGWRIAKRSLYLINFLRLESPAP